MPDEGQSYRVAVIGCGPRAAQSVTGYALHPRTNVVAICDVLPERTDALGDQFDVSARYSDFDVMLRETRPDIAVISTQADSHFELAMHVLDRGINVDVEKPMCLDLEQADTLVARSEARGVRVAAHHQYRNGVAMQALLQLVKDGRVGQIHHLEANCKGYYGGYGLMNIGCHLINNMIKFCGGCQSVVAVAHTGERRTAADDVVQSPEGMGVIAGESLTATLLLGDSATATLVQHRLPNVGRGPVSSVLEVVGTEGRLLWKADGAWFLPHPRFLPNGVHDQWEAVPLAFPPSFDASLGALAADDFLFADEYVRALDEGREHESSGAEATHVMQVLMGIFESVATGTRIDLPQVNRDHPLERWRHDQGLGDVPPAPRAYREWLKVEDLRLQQTGSRSSIAAPSAAA